MAEMIYNLYSDKTKEMFDKTTLKDSVFSKITALNGYCDAFIEGFDESSSSTWMGLMKPPTEIEKTYLIENPQASKWMKAYAKDQARIKAEYESLVGGLKDENAKLKEAYEKNQAASKPKRGVKAPLSPLALRQKIQQEINKNKKLRNWVSNPIEEREIPANYSRYMEGQSIRLSETQAAQDLTNLGTSLDDLHSGIISLKGSFDPQANFDFLFAGLLGSDTLALIDTIKAAITVCDSGWADVLSTLVSGNGLSQKEARRLVSGWIRTLRVLRNKCQTLLQKINGAVGFLVKSKGAIRGHLLSNSRQGTRDLTHREFFVWAGLHFKDSGLHLLANAYAANGYEQTVWADDYNYKTTENAPFITRADKLDLDRWFAHIGWNYSHVSDIDLEDLHLSSVDTPAKNKLFGIALDYIQRPQSKAHTLEGEE
jgi:hypothetical protein